MTGNPILSRFWPFQWPFRESYRSAGVRWPDLHRLWLHPEALPRFAAETPVIRRTLDLLGPLDWQHFPERNLTRHLVQPAVSYAVFAGWRADYSMVANVGRNSATFGLVFIFVSVKPSALVFVQQVRLPLQGGQAAGDFGAVQAEQAGDEARLLAGVLLHGGVDVG